MSKDKNKYSDKSTYKRDTIVMVGTLIVLFLAPIGITLYEGYKKNTIEENVIDTNIDKDVLEDISLSTPSNAEDTDNTDAEMESSGSIESNKSVLDKAEEE